ncbi:hypothetical protein ACIOD2_14390 [Amycolatopsis sp. NPDC088138]|uniref:hypothetical protein n=1 Tax=Amycolatopsis sp. NPDC088138 TaxID=3363938 RepID=UPI0037FD6634
MNSRDTKPGVRFLLSLIEPHDAAGVRQRLGIGEPQPLTDEHAVWELDLLDAPRSVLLWMLERDDPGTNRLVFHRARVDDALKRDILRGLPFGTATGPLPVEIDCGRPYCPHAEPDVPVSRRGLIGGLRDARTMGSGRVAARAVSRPDWPSVAEADRAEPLPGFARWALGVRIDCPPELRERFGSHPKFRNRFRRAGIVEPRDYAELGRPPRDVLAVLYFGTRLFPRRVAEAAASLTPLVRAELGANPDAWAVLAQLLPDFAGTVPELVATSGAVARV